MEIIGMFGPLLYLAFWIFIIWAVLALIGTLREIRSDVRTIREHVGQTRGREAPGPPNGRA